MLRGAAHPFDHLLDDRGIEFSHGQVIEEKKRLGALSQNVVDAMIQDVSAHTGMHSGGKRDLEFRPDAIRARNQNWILPPLTVKLKQRAESADGRQHAAAKSSPRHRSDAPLSLVCHRNIHACIGIAHGSVCFLGKFNAAFGNETWIRKDETDASSGFRPDGSPPANTCQIVPRRARAPRRLPARQWTYRSKRACL